MIDLTKYLTSDLIVRDLGPVSKEEAIKALVHRLFISKDAPTFTVDESKVLEDVMERETQQTTGIGNGLAIPHARVKGWSRFSVVMGISREGIDFASLDGAPVNLVFLLVSSAEEPYVILQAMSVIIRLMVEKEYSSEIMKRQVGSLEIIQKFKKFTMTAYDRIIASDLVRPASIFVSPDASVEEASRIMHLNHLDALPVLDRENKYRGELSCLNIFEFGMPDYFRKLHTISFVRHIDPFEKYFKIKGSLKVSDVYSPGGSVIGKDATLIEIIFDMTVGKKSQLYVVEDDGTMVGIIDRFCIIDKILFF
jgi:mannitol/fructose-specific phosphotransferase system IIA component (Ntr-type)